MPLPRRMRSVRAAANASAGIGSIISERDGSGDGGSCGSISTGCSPTQSDSKPSRSAATATSPIPSASASAPDPNPNHPNRMRREATERASPDSVPVPRHSLRLRASARDRARATAAQEVRATGAATAGRCQDAEIRGLLPERTLTATRAGRSGAGTRRATMPRDIPGLVAELTLDEKAALLAGEGLWSTVAVRAARDPGGPGHRRAERRPRSRPPGRGRRRHVGVLRAVRLGARRDLERRRSSSASAR